MSQRLGDLLVKEKIITPEQLEQANKVQKEQSCRLGSALVKLGFLTEKTSRISSRANMACPPSISRILKLIRPSSS
jgi:hypothetical protein